MGPKWHNNHHKTRSSRHTSRARTWLCLRTTLGHGGARGTNWGTEDLSMGDMGYKMLNPFKTLTFLHFDGRASSYASSCQLMPALLIFQTSPGGWASPVWIRKSNEVPKPRTTLGCQAVNSAGLQESPRFGGKTWPKAMDFLKKPGNHSIFSEISQDVGEINKENKLEIDGQKGFLMRRYATAS